MDLFLVNALALGIVVGGIGLVFAGLERRAKRQGKRHW